MNEIIEVITQMDSVMFLLVCGGLTGLVLQRIIGRFIKPNYYNYAKGP